MCGRFALWSDNSRLISHYGLAAAPEFDSGYNIAPSGHIPVIRLDPDKELALCQWGFIPHWARDTKLKPINAKAESIGEKPYFRDAFRRRRCLVPANGYFEWKPVNGRKQPYFIRMKEAELLSFAGVWSSWQGPDGAIESCAIITTAACDDLAGIHHRMPAIIEPDDHAAWLHEGGGGLLRPCSGDMEACRVSDRVNNPRNQGEALVRPLP